MQSEDESRGPPATVLGLASTALGTLALIGQPAGCCIPLFGSIVLFAVAAVGLLTGLGAYRQARIRNLVGIELAVIGLTLGVMNGLFAVLWFVVSTFTTLMGLIVALL